MLEKQQADMQKQMHALMQQLAAVKSAAAMPPQSVTTVPPQPAPAVPPPPPAIQQPEVQSQPVEAAAHRSARPDVLPHAEDLRALLATLQQRPAGAVQPVASGSRLREADPAFVEESPHRPQKRRAHARERSHSQSGSDAEMSCSSTPAAVRQRRRQLHAMRASTMALLEL
eukprot:6192119-Pleurochrysis_carterae.AAC.1